MKTVISTFDDRETAELASDRLIEAGFSRSAIHLQSGETAGMTTESAGDNRAGHSDGGFFASVSDFFGRLFDGDSAPERVGTYSEAVRRGGTVLAVDVADDSEAERADAIMDSLDTVDLDERAAGWRAEGWTGSAVADDAPLAAARPVSTADQQVLNVVQEELQVGKRTISKGGVRVVQRISETPVSELVTLREEHATIERRPVDRPASEADFSAFKEGTIELRETAEEAVVSKTARVVEEVVVGKDVQERTETINDTVRRTDVDVQRTPGQHGAAVPGSLDDGTLQEETVAIPAAVRTDDKGLANPRP